MLTKLQKTFFLPFSPLCSVFMNLLSFRARNGKKAEKRRVDKRDRKKKLWTLKLISQHKNCFANIFMNPIDSLVEKWKKCPFTEQKQLPINEQWELKRKKTNSLFLFPLLLTRSLFRKLWKNSCEHFDLNAFCTKHVFVFHTSKSHLHLVWLCAVVFSTIVPCWAKFDFCDVDSQASSQKHRDIYEKVILDIDTITTQRTL